MSRPPLVESCPKCGRRVLAVREDDYHEFVIGRPLIDPVALNQQQVIACVLAGIDLWQVTRRVLGWVTAHRDVSWPYPPKPGQPPYPGHIAPVHRCTATWDAPPIDTQPDRAPVPDKPPF